MEKQDAGVEKRKEMKSLERKKSKRSACGSGGGRMAWVPDCLMGLKMWQFFPSFVYTATFLPCPLLSLRILF